MSALFIYVVDPVHAAVGPATFVTARWQRAAAAGEARDNTTVDVQLCGLTAVVPVPQLQRLATLAAVFGDAIEALPKSRRTPEVAPEAPRSDAPPVALEVKVGPLVGLLLLLPQATDAEAHGMVLQLERVAGSWQPEQAGSAAGQVRAVGGCCCVSYPRPVDMRQLCSFQRRSHSRFNWLGCKRPW